MIPTGVCDLAPLPNSVEAKVRLVLDRHVVAWWSVVKAIYKNWWSAVMLFIYASLCFGDVIVARIHHVGLQEWWEGTTSWTRDRPIFWAFTGLILLWVATFCGAVSAIRQRDAAVEADVDRNNLVKTVRRMLAVAVDELSSEFTPAARSLSPHFLARAGKLTSLIAFSLRDGHRRRTLASAVGRWVPRYKDGRLDINELIEATSGVNEAIAAIRVEDVNPDSIAVGDSWALWVPPALPDRGVAQAGAPGEGLDHA